MLMAQGVRSVSVDVLISETAWAAMLADLARSEV
jgi:hypothetical protein